MVNSAATGKGRNQSCLIGEGLTKVYHTGDVDIHALRGAGFVLRAGELVVLLGPSGSGKSTLLNILGGLDTPTSGELYFEDHDLTSAEEHDLTLFRREYVGFVFQFYNLIPSLTARENVALVTEIAESPMTPEAALGIVGLEDRMDHFPAQLALRSGRWLDQPTRIALRQIGRWPLRAAFTCVGIASAIGLLIMALQWEDSIDYIAHSYFNHSQHRR